MTKRQPTFSPSYVKGVINAVQTSGLPVVRVELNNDSVVMFMNHPTQAEAPSEPPLDKWRREHGQG